MVWFTLPRRIEIHQNAHLAIESALTGSANLNIDDLGSGTLLALSERSPVRLARSHRSFRRRKTSARMSPG